MKEINIEDYKNIFFDRDGVINKVVIRQGLISSPRSLNEFELREDFTAFYHSLEKNKRIFVVTNQPDINRRLLDQEELNKMHKIIMDSFNIMDLIYCPHDNEDNCLCRKPKPGMINDLIKKYDLDPKECLLIGDSGKDIGAAKNAKIDSLLLDTKYNQEVSGVVRISSLCELLI